MVISCLSNEDNEQEKQDAHVASAYAVEKTVMTRVSLVFPDIEELSFFRFGVRCFSSLLAAFLSVRLINQ